MSGSTGPWFTITREAYEPQRDESSLLRELIPDIGKARSPTTIAHRHFWRAFELLNNRYPEERFHFHVRSATLMPEAMRPGDSCAPPELVDRLYLRHEATGTVFCLGTRFCTWRVYGPKAASTLADELATWLGFPATPTKA